MRILARLFAYTQYVLPRYWLTSIVHRLARVRHPGVKNFLITRFVRLYAVELAEVKLNVPADFATFNEFFIRELADGSRPIEASANTLVSPVDGIVSQAGRLTGDTILQAKGREYSLHDLLASDLDDVHSYVDGAFATLYLAPHNYHRVHAPFAGTLHTARYVPGDLFSVNETTAAIVPGLFHRNERLILHFATAHGPAAIIFVGALNVGSISTTWSGEIRPRKTGIIETVDLTAAPTEVEKGDLLGWFNMGSTVIVLLPVGVCKWSDRIQAGATVTMGKAIAELSDQTA